MSDYEDFKNDKRIGTEGEIRYFKLKYKGLRLQEQFPYLIESEFYKSKTYQDVCLKNSGTLYVKDTKFKRNTSRLQLENKHDMLTFDEDLKESEPNYVSKATDIKTITTRDICLEIYYAQYENYEKIRDEETGELIGGAYSYNTVYSYKPLPDNEEQEKEHQQKLVAWINDTSTNKGHPPYFDFFIPGVSNPSIGMLSVAGYLDFQWMDKENTVECAINLFIAALNDGYFDDYKSTIKPKDKWDEKQSRMPHKYAHLIYIEPEDLSYTLYRYKGDVRKHNHKYLINMLTDFKRAGKDINDICFTVIKPVLEKTKIWMNGKDYDIRVSIRYEKFLFDFGQLPRDEREHLFQIWNNIENILTA